MFGRAGYGAISTPLDLPPIVAEAAGDVAAFQAFGRTTVPNVPADQFTLFQLMGTAAASPIADLHSVAPSLPGSDASPDAKVRIELVTFQIAADEELPDGAQATLRIDMGKDRGSSSAEDALFWSIAAGLDLANQAVSKDPKERSADLSKPFRKRPIEIPGALAELRVELVAHKPPAWWRRIFSFADNAAVKSLVSAVGFPGIALDAVKLLDEALNRFETASAKTIFESRPLTVALTQRAAEEVTAGLDTVKAAVLNSGLHVLLRHRDRDLLLRNPPVFLTGYGRLFPRSAWNGESLKPVDPDPYASLSYAILRVKAAETKLNDNF